MSDTNKNISKESKVHAVADAIFHGLESSTCNDFSISLYGGNAGLFLFLSHYVHCYPSPENLARLEHFAERFAEQLIGQKADSHTWCSGMAGVFACFRHLTENSLTDFDLSDLETEYRDHLLTMMVRDLAIGNRDLLHGAMGVAYHYSDDRQFATTAIHWLEKSAVGTEGGGLKWPSNSKVFGGEVIYNIALSHGITGFLPALCRIYEAGIEQERAKALIEGIVTFILNQEIDHDLYGSYFPSYSLESDIQKRQSRLAWCYGDPGIAAVLWRVGKATGNEAVKSKAVEIMLHSSLRTDPGKNGILDAGLCHGSAGLAMIFEYMFSETGREEFRNAHEYWISQTLDMARFDDGPAGYKSYTNIEKEQWVADYGLLGGITGIGMALLSSLREDVRTTRWTSLFMM